MRRYLILCVVSISNACLLHAQRLPNALLWRITGNGLQKPCYLYGTMHLTDERLFNLGDSLYGAIEKSDGFAIEVSPEEMTPYLIDEVKQEIKDARKIRDVLNDREFKKYSTALSKKLNKPAEDITVRDIFREKNKWVSESYRKGKMATFLDIYLYDIARRLGKWTGGIEDMKDQTGLLDNLIDESDIQQIVADNADDTEKGGEQFIRMYVNNDLNGIDSIGNSGDSAYIDALLIRRNFKMANRMDSLARLRSMVFAVGAAHLPGEKGLISLLRGRGFAVEPVFPSRKIRPENFKVAEVNIPWVDIDDPDGFYKVQMPGKPGDILMYGIVGMKMYFDIFNGTGYLTTGISTPYDKTVIDSLMDDYARNIFHERDMRTGKDITINGIHGKELEKTDDEGYKHGFFLYRQNVIYIAVGFASKKETKGQQAVNRFLSSFQVFNVAPPSGKTQYTYIDSGLAYKIDLPSEPKSGNDLADDKDKTIKSSLKICSDQATGSYLFFGVNQASPGYFFENDSLLIRNIRQNAKDRYRTTSRDTMFMRNGRRVLEMTGIMKQVAITMKTYYECRGNRWYALVAMYDSTKYDQSLEHFFKSFAILEYPHQPWQMDTSKDELMAAWVPEPLKYYKETDSNNVSTIKYESYDSTRSDSYDIVVEHLGKYYWQNSDTAFWNHVGTNNSTSEDTLLYRRKVSNGEATGVELMEQQRGSTQAKRKRILLAGDTLYTLITVQPAEQMNSSNVNKFFEDFRFISTVKPTSIFGSKAKKLLDDLSSPDSATWSDAKHALQSADFTASDLPLLHHALLQVYPDSDETYGSITATIADHIINLKDNSSLLFAKENFGRDHDAISNYLLNIITRFRTRENYGELRDLLQRFPPTKEPGYSFEDNLRDSLVLTATMFPGLLDLLKNPAMAPSVMDIFDALVDSNILSMTMLHPFEPDLVRMAERRIKVLSADDDYESGDRSLIALLGKLNNAVCNRLLQKWLAVKPPYLKLRAVTALLENGQAVASNTLVQLAGDKEYRLELYDSLKRYKKLAQFPKQYLTQQFLAESMVYAAALGDEAPSALTYLTQKIVPVNSKKRRFFFYKVTYGDDEEKRYMLACAGPFDIEAGRLLNEEATGTLYYGEDFDPANLPQQMDALIREIDGKDQKRGQ